MIRRTQRDKSGIASERTGREQAVRYVVQVSRGGRGARRGLAAVVAAVVGLAGLTGLAATPAAAAENPTAPVEAPETPEGWSPYLPQVSCDPVAKPGTVALRAMLLSAYGGRDLGITRACDIG